MKWLAMCVMGAFAAMSLQGCAGAGGDQNYRELERVPGHQFQTERDPLMGPRIGPTRAPATRPAGLPHGQAISLAGGAFSRANWSRVSFAAASGRTQHGPLYFADAVKPVEGNLLDIQGTDARLSATLAGSKDHVFSRQNGEQLVFEPARFFFDVGVLPVNMVRQPPQEWTGR